MANSVDKIISDNVGLIYAQLNKFNLRQDQDAESLAYEALYRAALTYDTSKNTEFSTYATCCIYNALAGHLRSLKSQHSIDIVYLYDNVSNNEEYNTTHIDKICIDNSVESIIISDENNAALWRAICAAKDRLTGAAATNVIDCWIASNFTAKQKELAVNIGTSQSYVSTAISQFKKYLREEINKAQ